MKRIAIALVAVASATLAFGENASQEWTDFNTITTAPEALGNEWHGHCQGMCFGTNAIYFSHGNIIVKTDLKGDFICATTDVASHNGDICCWSNYVFTGVVNNEIAAIWVYKDNGDRLEKIMQYKPEGLKLWGDTQYNWAGADGITCLDGTIYLGLGNNPNEFRNYYGKFKFDPANNTIVPLNGSNIYVHVDSILGSTDGAQNMCTDGTYIYASHYTSNPETENIVQFDTNFNVVAKHKFGCGYGLDWMPGGMPAVERRFAWCASKNYKGDDPGPAYDEVHFGALTNGWHYIDLAGSGVVNYNSNAIANGGCCLGLGVSVTKENGIITSLVSTGANGRTITIKGDEMVFAPNAKITICDAGTLEFENRVQAQGALSTERGDGAYLVWSADAPLSTTWSDAPDLAGMTVGESNIKIDRIVSTGPDYDDKACGQQGLWDCAGDLAGGVFLCKKVAAAYMFTAMMQIHNGKIRCQSGMRWPHFGFHQGVGGTGSDIGLYTADGEGNSAGSASPGNVIGKVTDLGFRKVIVRRTDRDYGAMSVRFAGGVSFATNTSANTITIGAGIEAVFVAKASNAASIPNYTFSVRGDGDFKIEGAGGTQTNVELLGCDMSSLTGGCFRVEGDRSTYLTVKAKDSSVTGPTKFPCGGEVHVGANAKLGLYGVETNNWRPSLFVHRDGTLIPYATNNNQIANRQLVVLDGGTYNYSGGANYLNYLTMSNAVTTNVALRTGLNLAVGCPRRQFQYWRVVGDEPTIIANAEGVRMYGGCSASDATSKTCAFRIDVADVTKSDAADCTVLHGIKGGAQGAYDWFWLEKYGEGTLNIAGDARAVRMPSKIYNGTLMLGAGGTTLANSIMTNDVELCGGNLRQSGGHGNLLGKLSVYTNATLTVGKSGRLSFRGFEYAAGMADSAIVIDTGTNEVNTNYYQYVRIGGGRCLGANDLDKFAWKMPDGCSDTVEQDKEGYLYPSSFHDLHPSNQTPKSASAAMRSPAGQVKGASVSAKKPSGTMLRIE